MEDISPIGSTEFFDGLGGFDDVGSNLLATVENGTVRIRTKHLENYNYSCHLGDYKYLISQLLGK